MSQFQQEWRKLQCVLRGSAATVSVCTLNTRVHSGIFICFLSPLLFQLELVDGIAIATASLWQMHRYNKTQGKHTARETISVRAVRPVRHPVMIGGLKPRDLTNTGCLRLLSWSSPDVTGLIFISCKIHTDLPFVELCFSLDSTKSHFSLRFYNLPFGWQLTNVPPSWQDMQDMMLSWWRLSVWTQFKNSFDTSPQLSTVDKWTIVWCFTSYFWILMNPRQRRGTQKL